MSRSAVHSVVVVLVFMTYTVWYSSGYMRGVVFFFQAEDGIRDLVRSRGLGDVYKRQVIVCPVLPSDHK